MNYLKTTTTLFIVLFIIGFISVSGNATENKAYQNLDAKETFELIHNKQPLILDVRTPREFAAGHIKDSILIPVQVLNTDYIKIIDHKKGPILVYCRSGNRSVTASNILAKKGFKKLYNLKGGIKDWVNKGYPTQKQP